MSAPWCVYCEESQLVPALWGALVPIWRCEQCAAWELRGEETPMDRPVIDPFDLQMAWPGYPNVSRCWCPVCGEPHPVRGPKNPCFVPGDEARQGTTLVSVVPGVGPVGQQVACLPSREVQAMYRAVGR